MIIKQTTYRCLIACVLLQMVAVAAPAQDRKYTSDNIESVINGTSTLHAWNMKSSSGQCKATFTLNATEQLTGLTAMSFSIPAESLKSKNKSMDKNAYKALKTADNKSITFLLTSATYAKDGSVKCSGKLTIAGTTLDTEVDAVAKLNPDKSIAVTGTKKISMREFNMLPPTFMMGAVKTGNDITLSFDLTLAKVL